MDLRLGKARGTVKEFSSLTEREVLAFAISLEEEQERVYADFSEGLRRDFPESAAFFEGRSVEESVHRRQLIELYRQKFGEHIPLIRRQDVKGFVRLRPEWLARPLRLDAVRKQVREIEVETRRFYEKATGLAQDSGLRLVFDNLMKEERAHEARAAVGLEFQESLPRVTP